MKDYASIQDGGDPAIATMGTLIGAWSGAIIAVRDYLRNKKEENKKRKS